jgi:transcriptional regulator with XRE-family HTH domain
LVDGAKVKRWRIARGLNQRELATKSGVTPDAISQIEQGKRQPQPRTLTLLAEGLEVDPPMLLQDGASMSALIDDGAMLWRLQRPDGGWTIENAAAIDNGALILVRTHGIEHVYMWIARDAWDVVAPHLRYNMVLRAPGVKTDIGPRGTETDHCFALYKADPKARRPAYMQSLMQARRG